jgi:hypothetical protein
MDLKTQLGEYLQGALAGKLIENPAKVSESPGLFENFPRDAFIRVAAPLTVSVDSHQEISILIKNCRSGAVGGIVALRGEEHERGTIYDFQTAFTINPQQPGTCVTFNWSSPRFPTKITWTTSVVLAGQMGIGLPGCSATTVVVLPQR